MTEEVRHALTLFDVLANVPARQMCSSCFWYRNITYPLSPYHIIRAQGTQVLLDVVFYWVNRIISRVRREKTHDFAQTGGSDHRAVLLYVNSGTANEQLVPHLDTSMRNTIYWCQ